MRYDGIRCEEARVGACNFKRSRSPWESRWMWPFVVYTGDGGDNSGRAKFQEPRESGAGIRLFCPARGGAESGVEPRQIETGGILNRRIGGGADGSGADAGAFLRA